MCKYIIEIENLSKSYLLIHKNRENGSYVALRDILTDTLFRKNKKGNAKNFPLSKEKFWALKNASFKVLKGEKIGIIGKNGSGKTTLLKLLSRITEPSTGSITLRGRTASLLEIGTGFHPELTGRENIFLNGAILGMSRSQINSKFDEIVDFAETERFLDTPVKRYSSGMYLRLAFSVAAHLDPEILLVDEVLAVGDAAFQKKCLGKMNESTNSDRTLLFVSHNLTAVKQICDKVIWVDRGEIMQSGEPNLIIENYLKHSGVTENSLNWSQENAPGNEHIKLHSIEIITGEKEGVISTDTPIDIEFVFENKSIGSEINLSFILWTLTGECVFNTASQIVQMGKGLYKGICHIPSNLLNNTIYSIELMVIKDRSYAVFKQKDIITFEVLDGKRVNGWYGKWVGAVRPYLKFTLEEYKEN